LKNEPEACPPNARRASLRLGFEIGTQHCTELLDDSTVLGLVSKILVPENDYGILSQSGFCKCVQQAANECVYVADARQITVKAAAPELRR